MIRKHIVKNSFAVGGSIAIIYMLGLFYNGSAINKKIQGTWTAIEYSDTYTFTGNEYIHGAERGSYKILGNKIIFSGCEYKEYYVRMESGCLVIDGEYYLKY